MSGLLGSLGIAAALAGFMAYALTPKGKKVDWPLWVVVFAAFSAITLACWYS